MKIRIHSIVAIAATTLFLGVGSAHAVDFFFDNISGGTGEGGAVNPGDTITAELWFDTQEDSLQAWFLQVNQGGGSASAASVEPFLFPPGATAPATPLGSPVTNGAGGGNATGQFAFTISPPSSFGPGISAKYGSITLTAGASNISMDISEAGGAVGGPGGVDLVAAGLVTFDIIPVPEPSVALLGFAALGTLGLVRSLSGQRSA